MKISFWTRGIAKKDREIIKIPIINLKEDKIITEQENCQNKTKKF